MSALAPLATTTVLATAWALRSGLRWWSGNRALQRLGTTAGAGRPAPVLVVDALHRAGVDVDARVALRLWTTAMALAAALAVLARGGVILLAVVVVGPPVAVLAGRGRAARQRIRQLPGALDAIAAALRGGASLRAALADTSRRRGPLADELGRVAELAGAGVPLADALAHWADAADDPPSRLAGAALVVAAQLGGPGADALDAAAASLRERAAADDEIAALSVQARLSALVLTVAPVVFAALLTSLDPASAEFLLATPAGWACVAAGGALDVAGALWMARLVGRSA